MSSDFSDFVDGESLGQEGDTTSETLSSTGKRC